MGGTRCILASSSPKTHKFEQQTHVMISRRSVQTRYATTTRRTIARQAALAALIVVPGVACGNDDASVFESATTESTESTAADTATTESPALVPTPTVAPASNTTEVTAEAAELAVSFSFVPDATGGRGVENPYIAVWVEDLDGNLVQTVSLWYEQSDKGSKWLSDLPQWYSASGRAADVTMSGATQVAGDYTVAWDGSGLDGLPVPAGDYVVYVEAAREHGPYGITSQQFNVGSGAFTVVLPDSGELVGLSAALIS